MNLNVGKELAALRRLTVGELRARYAEVFGETTNSRHKDWLVKRIIWRLQAVAEGNLSERARARAAELANDADLRVTPPRAPKAKPATSEPAARIVRPATADERLPMPGTVLTREYKGALYQVTVLHDGFSFEGEKYKSLSAVAKAITGQHWNGYYFFRLGGGEGSAAVPTPVSAG